MSPPAMTSRRWSRSTPPRASLRTGAGTKPPMTTLAGFVPCAVSGMMMRLGSRPSARWAARITSRPVSSPWAPAAGCSVVTCRPEISASQRSSSYISSSAPCTSDSGWYGCRPAKPSSRAATSFTRGLYFIVHEPSG